MLSAQPKECKHSIYFEPGDPGVSEAFRREGVAVIRGFYKECPDFSTFIEELQRLAGELYLKELGMPGPDSLEATLMALSAHRRDAAVPLYHLATQPMKLMSGNQLKSGARTIALLKLLLGNDALLGCTHGSDNMLAVPPGEEFDRYILPIHQDFPYQLQSQAQIAFWIPLSAYTEGVGGLRVWPGSQSLGLLPSCKNANGHFECVPEPGQIERFSPHELVWDKGDLVVLDAFMLHQGIPNTTRDKIRLIQIFRYTDLIHPSAATMQWYSVVYPRRGTTLNAEFPGFDHTVS